MPTDHRAALAAIRRFDQLIVYLRDEMGWPIARDSFDDADDLFYDFTPEELGIDSKNAAKIQEIKRLRPLSTHQPWGIFFVKFEPKRLPVVALRRILSQVALKKRASANSAERAAWSADDLLFVSNYGEGDTRQISFAHFSQNEAKNNLPNLKVLGWDNLDTALHLDHVAELLTERLAWPDDENDAEAWGKQWRSAFTLVHREVINTSKKLSIELARLARNIRNRINTVLAIETEDGPVTKLMAAFKQALVHDLDEDGFADMYAQTIAYGLLSARVANPTGGTADDFAAAMPVTNPFLKELMESFLAVGGRKGNAGSTAGLDFDELGVSEVVELLDFAKMEAVVRDFGDRNPQEDPVIHFYELFLKEYDAKKRMQRGVFYTPRPVVSFIVRSVDELLRTEFRLEDGLADTATWGEMAERFDNLEIPKGATEDQVFVQILDPATGTGTFLVEVMSLIHKTMTEKWKAEGHSARKIEQLWNAYVPKHLLPRLHGYELMMAPYAIAHLKIGLKLYETGYRFGSTERARVYLTNALEPASDVGQLKLKGILPALAHEAKEVNGIKRDQRFTVVIGNPPYSGLSVNMSPEAQRLVDAYKIVDGEPLNERKLWLQDDYVKFVRMAQSTLEEGPAGVLGFITNHGYLNNPTFRGMRQSLLGTFQRLSVVDLHGNTNKKERCPDGSKDDNVFDIRQGVAICLCLRIGGQGSVRHANLWGTREVKYSWLGRHSVADTHLKELLPDSPFYFLEPQNVDSRAEYEAGWKITDIFETYGVGVVMARDQMTVDFDEEALWQRVTDFVALPIEKARAKYQLGRDARDWRVETAQADVRASGPDRKKITPILYRPFDLRFTYYTGNSRGFYASPCKNVMRNMLARDNLALVVTRSVEIGRFDHAFCTNRIIGHHSVSLKEVNYICPLWVDPAQDSPPTLLAEDTHSRPNLTGSFLRALGSARTGVLLRGAAPQEVFNYIYAVLHSPHYRMRYVQFLKTDFPRIPLPSNLDLFHGVAGLGHQLVALHLVESPRLDHFITTYEGPQNPVVGRVGWSEDTVWLDAGKTSANEGHRATEPGTIGFKGVPEEVWGFRIGGYQVCHKWLKDRQAKGGKNPRPSRMLTDDDIDHYQKIVVALSETIRIMAEIDEVIEEHGGWPGAFQASKAMDAPK